MTAQIDADQLEMIKEFVVDARDLINEIEPDILSIEDAICNDSNQELSQATANNLDAIFKLYHSIKGSAGILGLNNLVDATHTANNLLGKLKTGELRLTASHVDLLCKSYDFVKETLNCIEENNIDDCMRDKAQGLIKLINEGLTGVKVSNEPEAVSPQPVNSQTNNSTAASGPVPSINLDIDFADLITPETRKKFLEEAGDLLQEMEDDLLNLAKTPEDNKPVERLFRNFHSFKGNCGFLGFADPEKLSHSGETLIDTLTTRDSKDVGKIADLLLELIDVFKEATADIAEGKEGKIDGLDLYLEIINSHLPKEIQVQIEGAPTKLGDIRVNKGTVSRDKLNKALEVQDTLRQKSSKSKIERRAVKRQDIRVDIDKLDNLINLVGEMVIAENMVINNPELQNLELAGFNKASQHMSKIVRELQEMAMNIRMIPISGLFHRMTRLVHDLSRKSGKKVNLELDGETTEVDKTVIEKISDPLVHLIRNCIDHGIEPKEERREIGKPETGTIHLSARHEEGIILIKISDNGRGLDRQKLITKGIEKGIVECDGSQLSDKEAMHLIFQPNFSTAEKVTDISGRGVGMSVVHQNLESIKGRIDVNSSMGKGTTITLRIPLTLAIIDGMLTRTGSARYILPILSIRESFQPSMDTITITPDGQELVKIREHLLPVVRLHKMHNIKPDNTELDKGILVVLECRSGNNICLFVDELLEQQQTVIKNLSEYVNDMGDVTSVAGCTILGNGDVCLILDAGSIEEYMLGEWG